MGCLFSRRKPDGTIPSPNPTGSKDDSVRFSGLAEPVEEPKPREARSPSIYPIPKGCTVYKAQYDFDAINTDDLSFKKGDRLAVEETSTESDWWLAHHLDNGSYGYIPRNYIQKDDNSVESQEWWHNVDKNEAITYLLMPGNPTGTFLIRRATDQISLVLSIRDYDAVTRDSRVKHYRVREKDDGTFYVAAKRSFETLFNLLDHYKDGADGLCCRLTKACPKERPPVTFREFEVPRETVVLGKKLGSGCFGEVFIGKWRSTLDVAVKTLRPGTMSPDAFLEEAKIMSKLCHRRLVQLLAVCSDTEPIWIIQELVKKGALLDCLREDLGNALKENDLITMASQIAEGMAYLEAQNFVHRDLRAANILVGINNDVKVADFGLARIIPDDVYKANKKARFPVKWTAPEAAFHRLFTIKSDVWSFGILLYEIITFGRVPYPGMERSEVLDKVDAGYRMPKPSGGAVPCPEAYYDVMLQCWNIKPESRPTFEYLYNTLSDFAVATQGSYE